MATITLKNIPDDLYTRLKARARVHRRSVNSELICCLETVLTPSNMSVEERLRRFRSLRPRIDPRAISADEMLEAIDQGRP